jgi:hypothetical protein
VHGGDYGFPTVFGTPPAGSGTIGPVVNLQQHSSSDGFVIYQGTQYPAEYQGNVFIAQWGANNSDPAIGKRVVRVPLTRSNQTFTGHELVFATGFDHPIDVIEDRQGALLVADYGSGIIYRITSQSQSSGTATTTQPTGSSTTPNSPTTVEPVLLDIVLIVGIMVLGAGLLFYRRRKPNA